MEDIENNNSQKIDPVQVRQVENVTYQNFHAAHEAKERRRQLNEAWQTLKDNNVDYDGKIFHNASLQSRKMIQNISHIWIRSRRNLAILSRQSAGRMTAISVDTRKMA